MADPLELIIFDCDGVLVDSERIAVPIDRVVLAELGWNMTEHEVVERFLGRSEWAMARDVAAHLGRAGGAGEAPAFLFAFKTIFRLVGVAAMLIAALVAWSAPRRR